MLQTTFSLFLVGLLGGAHCFGMCGGIVVALAHGQSRWTLHLAYNAGRILTYALAGVLVGALGSGLVLAGQWPLRLILLVLANLMLVGMGLYLLGFPQWLAPLERLGGRLWRRVQPLGKRFLPVRAPAQALSLGLLWGWLPCGLVYSALATALGTGSAWQGGLAMLAFGLGTLPNLLLAGMLAGRAQTLMRWPPLRLGSGLLVLGFGVYGLLGAWRLAQLL